MRPSTPMRPLVVQTLAQTFYLKEAVLGFYLKNKNKMNISPRFEEYMEEVFAEFDSQLHDLADVLLVYLLHAVWGELRYSNTIWYEPLYYELELTISSTNPFVEVLGLNGETIRASAKTRVKATEFIHTLEPKGLLKFAEMFFVTPINIAMFARGKNTSVGGEKWAKIAKVAQLYFSNKYLFIDQILSLEHNTGSVFTKSDYELVNVGSSQNRTLRDFLNDQATADLLSMKPISRGVVLKIPQRDDSLPTTKTLAYAPWKDDHDNLICSFIYINKLYSFAKPILTLFNKLLRMLKQKEYVSSMAIEFEWVDYDLVRFCQDNLKGGDKPNLIFTAHLFTANIAALAQRIDETAREPIKENIKYLRDLQPYVNLFHVDIPTANVTQVVL